MAKFKAKRDFTGYKEKRRFKKGEEIEMTVKRAKELQANVDKNFPHVGEVMERIDVEEAEVEEVDEGGE